MKVYAIPHAIFETTRLGFIQILHHRSMPWKINPLYFCSSDRVYFGPKESIEKNFSDFCVVGCKFYKSFCWKYIKFQLKDYRGVISHDTEEWYRIWSKTDLFLQKKTKIWWILIRALKILKISTLIGSFCVKYIAFYLKKNRGVIFHGTARKTIFPKSWNITKSSKMPRKYQLSINFLDQKKTVVVINRAI